MHRTALLVISLVIGLAGGFVVAGAVESPGDGPAGGGGPSGGGGPGQIADGALQRFAACDDLAAHMRQEALSRVTAWGLPRPGGGAVTASPRAEMPDAAEAAGADGAARASAPAAPSATGTNVQVAGVDEPDMVKTGDGLLVTASHEAVHVLRLEPGGATMAGGVDLEPGGGEPQLLLSGRRLLVIQPVWAEPTPRPEPPPEPLPGPGSDAARPGAATMRAPGTPVTRLLLVDLGDPSRPAVVSSSEIEGSIVAGRQIDGDAVLVTSSRPRALPFDRPAESGPDAEDRAVMANRAVVQRAGGAAWLPHLEVRGSAGETVHEGPATTCTDVATPTEFAGFGTLTVQQLDLGGGDLVPTASAAVVADGQHAYATAERLYVATTDRVAWEQLGEEQQQERVRRRHTDIHAFSLEASEIRHVASGEVAGTLLNQFSMDEHDGHLRVATTRDRWDAVDSSDSAVTVLARRGDRLEAVGQVTGLGRGERIYAVRFMGELGYVVTFRQVDPLYSLDLSDPADPRVTGELKILGYSAYLHPVADGRLLGVGQDATADGRTTGLQASLFDIADPRRPARLDQVVVPGAGSEVEADHHAFLYWPPTGTAVVPLQRRGVAVEPVPGEASPPAQPAAGALVLDVGDGDVRIRGEISHDTGEGLHGGQIRRSVVAGGDLHTVSADAVVTHDLDSLEMTDRVALR